MSHSHEDTSLFIESRLHQVLLESGWEPYCHDNGLMDKSFWFNPANLQRGDVKRFYQDMGQDDGNFHFVHIGGFDDMDDNGYQVTLRGLSNNHFEGRLASHGIKISKRELGIATEANAWIIYLEKI